MEDRSAYDAWAVLLIGKVLALYAQFTEDPVADDALYRAMKKLHDLLICGEIRLFDWENSAGMKVSFPCFTFTSKEKKDGCWIWRASCACRASATKN